MKPLRFFAGSALLATVLGLSLSGCDLIPDAGAKPKVSVTYQETTATVTATWSRPSNVQSSWDIYYEWTNERISGGNACSKAEATTQTTVTFTCGRSEQTVGVMEFTVWAVRNVGGTLYPGAKRSTQYNVEPTGVVPPDAIDSLTINVTDASGVHRQLAEDLGMKILYELEDNGDTTWRYTPYLTNGDSLKDLVVQTGLEHTGIQLTALAWKDEQVVACDGDCGMYPAATNFEYPWGMPIQQAYNPFPPAIDVLGR